MGAKGASVCLGHHLSPRAPGAAGAMATGASVNELEIFLQRLYFSATNYIYSKTQLSKALDNPGDTASLRGCGDLGGINSPSSQVP